VQKFVVRPTRIPEVRELKPAVYGDSRGTFGEVYSKAEMARLGIEADFIQDNQSVSSQPGTVRGLHFQLPPYAQAKLVRVVRGAIFDVAVDLRTNSSTYRQWVSSTLTADEWWQIFIPVGFAHGFCTLEPDTVVLYKVDAPYSQPHERGISWSDPELAITWPIAQDSAVLSEKDKNLPLLKDVSPSLINLVP
jgi:dTDP-4-dehydrorhamnose 3,5-epimerase